MKGRINSASGFHISPANLHTEHLACKTLADKEEVLKRFRSRENANQQQFMPT